MDIAIFWVGCAVVSAIVAGAKGRSSFGWLIIGIVFGLFALIVIACLPSIKPQPVVMAGGEVATPDTHVRCPECRELVRRDAKRCKHCQITLIPQ